MPGRWGPHPLGTLRMGIAAARAWGPGLGVGRWGQPSPWVDSCRPGSRAHGPTAFHPTPEPPLAPLGTCRGQHPQLLPTQCSGSSDAWERPLPTRRPCWGLLSPEQTAGSVCLPSWHGLPE